MDEVVMLRKWFHALICSILVTPSVCARCSEINEQFKTDDPRLQQKVSIAPRRMLLGDLLAELQKQTGVLIEEDGRDQAAGTEVLVSCKEMPLCDLLDALWA